MKIIDGKIKAELKSFKIESSKHLSESLIWYNKQINVLKEECKSKDIIIAKLSRTIGNLTRRKTQVISQDVQANSHPPAKEPPIYDLDEIQEEVTEFSNTK